MLCDYGGLTQRQVAEVLGIGTGSPISRQLRKLTGELQSNRTLQKQVGAITAELRGYTPNANDYRKG
jgi:transcriptional regulator with XRE-family HTH domain